MNKIFHLLTVLVALFCAINLNAATYTLQEGNNVLTAANTQAECTFVVHKDGRVVIEAQQTFTVTYKGTEIQHKTMFGTECPYKYEVKDVTVGDEIKISGYVMNTSTRIMITSLAPGEVIPVKLVSVSQEAGNTFNWSNDGNLSISFSKAIKFNKIIMAMKGKQYDVTNISLDGNNLTLGLAELLNRALLIDKTLNPGDPFVVQITGIVDRDDPNSVFQGPNGNALQLNYKAPYPRYDFIRASIGGQQLSYTNFNTYKMKSYYDTALTTDGIIEVEFSNDVKSVNGVILTMGNIDLSAAGKFHRSELPYTIEGKKVFVDLRGKLRSLHSLFPNIVEDTEGGNSEMMEFNVDQLTISLNNVVDVNDNPFYSSLPGSVGTFAFSMGYEEIQDNLLVDINGIAEGDAVKDGQTIELWVNEPLSVDSVSVTYLVNVEADGETTADGDLGYQAKTITTADFKITPDPKSGYIISFVLPEMTGAIEGESVTVSLVNAKSENGLPHDVYVKFVYNKKKTEEGGDPTPGPGPDDQPTEPGKYKIHTYAPNDGGILMGLSANGKWATIRLGNSNGGGDAIPEVYEVDTEKHSYIAVGNQAFDVYDISDDGNIAVGSFDGEAASYNFSTKKVTKYPQRKNWRYGTLTDVTPDGKWAVGGYNCYTGNMTSDSDIPNDFYYTTLFVNIETGDTIATPGTPKRDMAHLDQNAKTFNAISPDGRYIIGSMSWFIMQPVSGFVFIYDTQEHTYKTIGFEERDYGAWKPEIEGLHHIENAIFSPDGNLVAGNAYMAKPREDGSEFFNEYLIPFLLDMKSGEIKYFDDGESNNLMVDAIDNAGTMFGNPESGGPLRNFRIFYRNKYWIPFSEICKQRYGFDFQEKTNFEYTGTAIGVSGDGTRFVAFSDPNGESYVFDFGETVEQACAGIDLFANYSVTPEEGASFSELQTMEINFGRPVQVIGKGNTHVHIYDEEFNEVAVAMGSANGLQMKADSRTTVSIAFRPVTLDPNKNYVVAIDKGAIAIASDADITNKDIYINYTGRKAGPVQALKVTPADNSSIRQIDNTASYINIAFDSPVKLTTKANAYVLREADNSIISTLVVSPGNTEATKNQVLLTPPSTTYLYDGQTYKVVLDAGSVTDRSGVMSSANEKVEVTYVGTYVREVVNETVMFSDNFDNPNESLNWWLMYEGDRRTPVEAMKELGFDGRNTPWNFTIRDSEETTDYFAMAHSMYTPAGRSNDWMMTPQLRIPSEGNVVLEFDAQGYDPTKQDVLKLYVYENKTVLSNPLDNVYKDIVANAVLLDSLQVPAGPTMNTTGEWTHYVYDLTKWAGKDIYVAFVNQNTAQSGIFVNNVIVQREVLYTIGFSNSDRVVGKTEQAIAGEFTVKKNDFLGGDVSLTLMDADKKAISTVSWTGLEASAKDQPMRFAFDKTLPLTVGIANKYYIEVKIADRTDVYEGAISDLAFEPVKRVVLEEMTGTTCINCPLGIVSIEQCERTYGDRFIPISAHSYTGDRLGAQFEPYTTFLGLNGAPLGRINRIPGVYSPMVTRSGDYLYDSAQDDLWYNIVSQELNRLAPCDVTLAAAYSDDDAKINLNVGVNYALNTSNEQLSLLVAILENGLVGRQSNTFSQVISENLGDFGLGGKYGNPEPTITHNDVLRGLVGQTFSGSIGILPATYTAGEAYHAVFSTDKPGTIYQSDNVYAVAMIIDTQSGEIINAAKTKVLPAGSDGIEDVKSDVKADKAYYNILGQRINTANAKGGIFIVNGKKYLQK